MGRLQGSATPELVLSGDSKGSQVTVEGSRVWWQHRTQLRPPGPAMICAFPPEGGCVLRSILHSPAVECKWMPQIPAGPSYKAVF